MPNSICGTFSFPEGKLSTDGSLCLMYVISRFGLRLFFTKLSTNDPVNTWEKVFLPHDVVLFVTWHEAEGCMFSAEDSVRKVPATSKMSQGRRSVPLCYCWGARVKDTHL